MDPTTNPLTVAGYVLGALISIPVILACVKFIYFIAKLDTNFETLMSWMKKMEHWKHDVREKHQEFELGIDRNTRDIEYLKDKLA